MGRRTYYKNRAIQRGEALQMDGPGWDGPVCCRGYGFAAGADSLNGDQVVGNLVCGQKLRFPLMAGENDDLAVVSAYQPF